MHRGARTAGPQHEKAAPVGCGGADFMHRKRRSACSPALWMTLWKTDSRRDGWNSKGAPEGWEPLRRLGRIEGQLRGLAQMAAADRHCLEAVQRRRIGHGRDDDRRARSDAAAADLRPRRHCALCSTERASRNQHGIHQRRARRQRVPVVSPRAPSRSSANDRQSAPVPVPRCRAPSLPSTAPRSWLETAEWTKRSPP